jgi:hypothetical protein
MMLSYEINNEFCLVPIATPPPPKKNIVPVSEGAANLMWGVERMLVVV